MKKETKNLAYKTLLFAILLDSFQFTFRFFFCTFDFRVFRLHRHPSCPRSVQNTHTHSPAPYSMPSLLQMVHDVGAVVPRRSSNTKQHELVMPVSIRIRHKKQERSRATKVKSIFISLWLIKYLNWCPFESDTWTIRVFAFNLTFTILPLLWANKNVREGWALVWVSGWGSHYVWVFNLAVTTCRSTIESPYTILCVASVVGT